MRLILDRPYRYTIKVNGGTVHGSEPFECSPRIATQLLARYAAVRQATAADLGVDAPADALADLSLADLRDHAAKLGVENADKLRTKQAVVDAIHALAAEVEQVQVQITTDADGDGWVQVPGPPAAISDPAVQNVESGPVGTITVTAVDGQPEQACLNLAAGPESTTVTVSYTFTPQT